MEKKPGLRQYLNLFLLFGITGLLLGFTVDVTVTDEAGIVPELPDQLGDQWTGHDILFCHNQHCGRDWLVRDLEPNADGVYTCPRDYSGNPCGSKLHTMSLGEWNVLPKDTVLLKKRYFRNENPDETVFASIVLSGDDRSSIHRPEVCMVGQGNRIDSSEVIEVSLDGRDPLQVMVLNMSRDIPGHATRYTYYAYWFVGRDKETPHHMERAFWMAWDRIFRNVSHRWAYLAVSGPRSRDLSDTRHHGQIRNVVAGLYPQIALIDADGE